MMYMEMERKLEMIDREIDVILEIYGVMETGDAPKYLVKYWEITLRALIEAKARLRFG